jgi:predicted dehydrogenase
MTPRTTRREFLDGSGKLAAALGFGITAADAVASAQARAAQPKPAGQSPVMGLIGCGGMGRGNMNILMDHGVPFAAVCDVDDGHLRAAAEEVYKKQQRRPEQIKDFRKLLERRDIDAVVIATPDHWHALPAIYACEAGKDIYLEKPISHDIVEGRAMVAAAKKHRRVVQVGTWQRSTKEFVDAVDYIRNGRLGKVTTLRAWKTDPFQMGHNAPKPPPSGLDYDFWVGPAQMTPYTDRNCHVNWRWFWNTGNGMTGDWGVHMMDIGLLAMSASTDLVMPTSVAAYGGKLAWPDDDRTTPDTHLAIAQFPGFVMHWETGRKPLDNGPDHGTEFIAADGSALMVWRGGWRITGPDGQERPKTEAPGFNGKYDHWQNFLDCVATRQQPRSDLESMYQTTTVCHLANAAYLAGEPVRWDKAKNDVQGKPGKNTQSYEREYRKPWSLPR